jgi:hypothetical protein
MEHIVTFMGEEFTPLEPDINQIHIEDIAHALSLLCRANGHIVHFYSIAQHSINCANEAKAYGYSARIQLACLIHDASEAYISDITRPVKYYLSEYKVIEKRLQEVIYTRFLGEPPNSNEFECVNQIDNDMLIHEFDALMKKRVYDSLPQIKSTPAFECRDFKEVENEFLKSYYGIMHAGLIQGR